jgi:hypothetical protein
MSNSTESETLLNGSKKQKNTIEDHSKPPDWNAVKWRQLEHGEVVQMGDWSDVSPSGYHDWPQWKMVTKSGGTAPDPAYPAHRIYRRITWTPDEAIEIRLCKASRIMLRPNQTYRFTVDPNCEKCAAAAKPYLENVKEHAPPPLKSDCAETEELHGGCCVSSCSDSSSSNDNVVITSITEGPGWEKVEYMTTDGKPPHPDSDAVQSGIVRLGLEKTYIVCASSREDGQRLLSQRQSALQDSLAQE